LDTHFKEFLAAKYEDQEKIVMESLESFKRAWPQHVTFDAASKKTVCAKLATLGCSHIFLAYLPAPLRQGQTSAKGICTYHSKPGS
jgi:hypothetical protein